MTLDKLAALNKLHSQLAEAISARNVAHKDLESLIGKRCHTYCELLVSSDIRVRLSHGEVLEILTRRYELANAAYKAKQLEFDNA